MALSYKGIKVGITEVMTLPRWGRFAFVYLLRPESYFLGHAPIQMLPFLIEVEGYRARVERTRDGLLHGRVIEINEVINFKATTFRMVETQFMRALQAYFSRCQQNGTEPEKPVATGY